VGFDISLELFEKEKRQFLGMGGDTKAAMNHFVELFKL
jgi:hypothetical protein